MVWAFIKLFLIALGILVVVAIQVLDWRGRAEIIERHFPRVWQAMNSRPTLLILLVVVIAFLGKDFRDAVAIAPPPVIKIPAAPVPIIQTQITPPSAKQAARKNRYAISLDDEYASISNIVAAFNFLQQPERESLQGICQVKITAPQENLPTARIIATLAGQAGCKVTGPGNPDLNPDLDLEAAKGASRDLIIVDARKEYWKADGFITWLGNVFSVRRRYDLPSESPPNLIWLQFGPGSVWRRD